MKSKIIFDGRAGDLASETLKKEIVRLHKTKPDSTDSLEVITEWVKEVSAIKTEVTKLSKHLNRLFVIGNGMKMDSTMQAHIEKQALSIFDYGSIVKDETEE